jgi:hypothetical protein
MKTLLACIAAGLLCSGCAVITPVYDSHGNIIEIKSTKFLADLSYESVNSVEYAPDGKTILKQSSGVKMETKTNADRILGEVVKGAGVLVDGAGKLMP